MALASDLMGLGVPDKVALVTASGGNGPLTASAAGSNFATATKIQANQYVVAVGNANGTVAMALPTVGGDTGCKLGDSYNVANVTAAGTLVVYASSGVAIASGGNISNTSNATIATYSQLTFVPISTTQWICG